MKNRITRYLSIIILSVLTGVYTPVKAQHEFSVYAGGGLSTLRYKTDAGDQKNGSGGLLGIGYRYMFSEMWGLGSGIEISLYNSKSTLDNFSYHYMAMDNNSDSFEFRTKLGSYEEKQQAYYLNIPLMAYLRIDGNIGFYAAAGGKIGIPLSTKYKTTATTLTNSGYYAYEDYEYTEQQFMGFGVFSVPSKKESFDLKPAFMLSAEVGANRWINDNILLYIGAYFDYGLNDIRKSKNSQQLIPYNTAQPTVVAINSMMNSQYVVNGQTADVSDKVVPFAVGIKLGATFSFSNR